MHTCYRCDHPLTKGNYSIEHIIPNACGGKLKSSHLLCRSCNSIYGDFFDNALADSTNVLMNLLLVSRDRGEPQKIKTSTIDTNEEIYLEYGGEISYVKPLIKFTNIDSDNIAERRISVRAPNEKILNQVLNGLKRKYPNLNIEEALRHATISSKRFEEGVEINGSIGGQEVFKSILKTAINFFIVSGGERKHITDLLPLLETTLPVDNVWMYYPDDFIYMPARDEVSHVLKVVGNPAQKILYAYIELFNVHCFLVKLSCNYSGPTLNCDYVFNVLTQVVERNVTSLNIDRDALLEVFDKKNLKAFQIVQDRYERVVKISHYIQHAHQRSKLLSEAVDRALKDIPSGTVLTEDHLVTMRKEVFDVLSQFTNRKF